jgi:aspartyl-tRNA(Asn)/glutamyl-tRNA(Gln) amidotransferase subunit A
MTSILDEPLAGIAAALESGRTSAEEPARLAIGRHEELGARLDAYQVWNPDATLNRVLEVDRLRARASPRALGPLAGLPISVKDLFGGAFLERHLPDWMDLLDRTVGDRIRGAAAVEAHRYLSALADRDELVTSSAGRWEGSDVLVTPTVPITAPTLGEVECLDDYIRRNRLTSRGTNPVNVLEACAISVPCGLDGRGHPDRPAARGAGRG